MVRKSAHANTRSFKPQKLFRPTNSFYKAGCALIPVISKIEGRGMAGKSTCLWKRTWDANIVVARCFSPRAHALTHPCFCRCNRDDTETHAAQTHRSIHTHTFPGGDESCQQLAEVGSGVCILLSRRESFQLGGRAAVLEVVLSQGVGISLEES